jgi:SAM-dependent methyltransferase
LYFKKNEEVSGVLGKERKKSLNQSENSTDLFVFGLTEDDKIAYQHPWKLSRGDCVLDYLKNKNLHNIADIGVNDMFYTKKMKSFAARNVYAVDTFFPEDGMVKDGIVCVKDICKLPDNEFDAIIMMDVLEHIENDKLFFNTVVAKLKDNGIILITVPAWQFLFSVHDGRLQHYRRYNRKRLLSLLDHNDIEMEKCHYFYTILFLARFVFLFRKEKFSGNEIAWKYSEKNVITIIIKAVLDMDYWINRILDKIGIHLPGLSLIAMCRKIV